MKLKVQIMTPSGLVKLQHEVGFPGFRGVGLRGSSGQVEKFRVRSSGKFAFSMGFGFSQSFDSFAGLKCTAAIANAWPATNTRPTQRT